MRASQRAAHGAKVLPVLIRSIALFVVLASPAAACPTAADLDRGISFIREDGSRQDHRRTGDGWVEVGHVRAVGSQIGWSLTAYGVQTLEDHFGAERPDAWEILQGPTPNFDAPQLGTQTQRTRAQSLGQSTQMQFQTRIVLRTQEVPTRKRISGCDLEVYRVGTFEQGPALTVFRAYDYFPELGTGVLVGMRVGEVEEITAGVDSILW